jgi:hypothetical protein
LASVTITSDGCRGVELVREVTRHPPQACKIPYVFWRRSALADTQGANRGRGTLLVLQLPKST